MGSVGVGIEGIPISDAVDLPTAGSKNANRHMSTRGKRESTGRTEAICADTSVHANRMNGVADGSEALVAFAGWNRDLRYGRTVVDSIDLTFAFGKTLDSGHDE